MLEEAFFNRRSERVLKVEEATLILKGFGLSNNDKKTREYVNQSRLKAIPYGSSMKDKRAGYGIQMSHLITFIFEELPAVKALYERLEEPKKRTEKQKKDDSNTAKITDIEKAVINKTVN